jgi:hypothetical protein
MDLIKEIMSKSDRHNIDLESMENVIEHFRESAILHKESSWNGDYKKANKAHDEIIGVLKYLYIHNNLDELYPLLKDPSLYVREWAATYLLPKYEKEAIATLKEIDSFEANIVLEEWKKGSLDLSLVYGHSDLKSKN